jgi:eukaryotic-like serine/threonine-protein kinase
VRLTPGTRVGPYEVVALLGAGGMAEVYRAKDTRLGRDVALKMVSEALGADAAFLERFEREAKLAGSLAHPNVVALYDVGFHDGKPYFVTELLQGESLRERLGTGPIPLATSLEWAAQMAQGLAAAHERGIAHRDLKPENIFVTRDGHVKLLDFGIAKLVEGAQGAAPHDLMDATVSPSGSSTGTGMVLGTPGYMSPEQVRGDPVDARTDFFSLGAVLYEMLSGQRAFPAGPVVESGYAILHDEPESLTSTVPPQVVQVVQRCLQKIAGKRFQSARDLAFNLELVRMPAGSGASTATAPGGSRRPQRWRAWLWPAAAIAAFGFAGATYVIERRTRLPPLSVEQITFRRGTVTASRFDPDGRIVYSAGWGAEPKEIYTRSPASSDAQPLGVRGADLLSVSEKGELAISLHTVWVPPIGAGGTLALVPGTGGTPRPVAENIVSADWSRAGELAVVRYVDDAKRQLEYPLGRPIFESAGLIVSPRVSPNGDTVAFIQIHETGSEAALLLVDRRGVVRRLLEVEGNGLAWAPSGEEVWVSTGNAIWACPLKGSRRLVYQGISQLSLEDISRDGKVLVNLLDERREMVLLPAGHDSPRELPWLDVTVLGGLSDDGRQVLFSAYSDGDPFTYLRPTDGSSPQKLGAGEALAISPDGKWVLSRPNGEADSLILLPVGVGVPKTVAVPGLHVVAARWISDGKRIVVLAKQAGGKYRLYVVPVDGGEPTPLSDGPVIAFYLEVSRDDRFVAATTPDGTLTLYPLDGSPPVPLPTLGSYTVPSGWTLEGQLWASDNLRAFRDTPSRLRLYDVAKHSVIEERIFSPADVTGLVGIGRIRITPDSRMVVYEYARILTYLYELKGLTAARP